MIKLIWLVFLFVAGSAFGGDLPQLENTKFFTETAHGCRDVNMERWSHPTKQIFIEKGVKLKRVSLCNNNKLPVFYAEVPYDPHFARNDNYFFPMYRGLLKANGWWPFAIVDTSDNTIIFVSGDKKNIKEDLEMYTQ
jgi:hypothetical protein